MAAELFKTNCISGAGGHVSGIFLTDLFYILSYRSALGSFFFPHFSLPAKVYLSVVHNFSRIYFFPPTMLTKFDSERLDANVMQG